MTVVYSAAMEHARVLAYQKPAPVKNRWTQDFMGRVLAAMPPRRAVGIPELSKATGIERIRTTRALTKLAMHGRVVRIERGMYRRAKQWNR